MSSSHWGAFAAEIVLHELRIYLSGAHLVDMQLHKALTKWAKQSAISSLSCVDVVAFNMHF